MKFSDLRIEQEDIFNSTIIKINQNTTSRIAITMGNSNKKRANQNQKQSSSRPADHPHMQVFEPPPAISASALPNMPRLPKPGQANRNRCILGRYGMYSQLQDERVLLPLTKVAIRSELFGAFATSTFELTYVNPSDKHPLNCSFSFPMEDTSAVVDFEACIDDRKIKTRV